jgi:hypothetical protein
MIFDEIKGFPMKMMSDKIVIDEEKKIVYPYDLKVMGNIDIFPYNYLKLRYYLQLAVYTTLLKQHYKDYTVMPLRFITVDKYRYMDPVLVKTSELDYQSALQGFKLNNHQYKGLYEILEDIQYHKTTNIWTSSKEAQINKGVVTLKFQESYGDTD